MAWKCYRELGISNSRANQSLLAQCLQNLEELNRDCASICKHGGSGPWKPCVAPKILQTGIESTPTGVRRRRRRLAIPS